MAEIDIGLCGNQHICENDTDYIMKILRDNGIENGLLLDLACGTGRSEKFQIFDGEVAFFKSFDHFNADCTCGTGNGYIVFFCHNQ